MPSWQNCYNGSTGSAKDPNNAAKDLDLFTSSATAGYNYDSGTIKSGNGLWEARCFGRAHSYSSSEGTYSYSMYVFAKKLNGATSHGDSFKVTFYYRGKSDTNSGLTRYLNGSGETRLISSHTFTGLSGSPSGTSTIGAKVTGEEGTEVYQTINLTETANFNDDTWSVASKTDSSIKLSGTKIASRNFRHARYWQYKKASASSYTTDDSVNYAAANEGGSATHTFSSLSRNTAYDVRVQFRLRNLKPKNTDTDTETGNNTVILSGLTWSKEVDTDKSDLSGSVSLSGTNKVGKVLTAKVTNTNSATLDYQWSYDTNSSFGSGDGTQTVISGATSNKLTVPAAAAGNYIYCKVTFTKDNYNTKTIREYTSGKTAEAPPTVTAPTMKTSLTYAGSALALINAGKVTNGTMYYYANTSGTAPAASNSSFSTSVPTGLPTTGGAAQTYHVWYKVVGNKGYTDVGVTKIGSVTVNPGTFTVTKVPYSGNYNGSAHKASIKVNLAGCVVKSGTASGTYGTSDSTSTTANAAVTLGATSRTNAGSTTVYYQVTKNYYKTVTGSTTITINKIAPTVTAPTLKSAQTYTGSALAYVNAGSVTGGTMYYYGSTSSTTPTSITSTSIPTGLPTTGGAAQTYYAWYKVVGDSNHTDVAITKIGTSTTINPGVITVTKVPYSGTYDGSAHKASVKVNIAGCTVKSGSASGTYGTTDNSNTTANTAVILGAVTRTNAGSSTVYYQISKSYYATVTGSTAIDIAKAPLSATVTASGTAQYGKTLNTVIQAASGTGAESYQWWHSTSSTATSGTNISGATGYNYTIGSGLVGKYIGVTVSFAESTNYLGGVRSDIIPSAVIKAAGSGSVTMNGWTYRETPPNPTPSSSTNGTSGVSYTWYNSNKTALSAKPTSTSNAGIYYVRATFPAATDYNAYTTDYVGFTVLPSVSLALSQNYLDGDYGALTGTITYSLGGGVGSCTNISLTNGNRTLINNAAIKQSDSVHPNFNLSNSTIAYSITYKDENNTSKTLTGTKTFSLSFIDSFTYDYSHKNENGEKVSGMLKDFVNDGMDKTKQFCLTAEEWNQMNKYLYSAAVRKNGWSNLGIPVPTEVSQGNRLSAILFNSALEIAEIITNTTYNQVTSGSRITSEQLNGFIDILGGESDNQ